MRRHARKGRGASALTIELTAGSDEDKRMLEAVTNGEVLAVNVTLKDGAAISFGDCVVTEAYTHWTLGGGTRVYVVRVLKR